MKQRTKKPKNWMLCNVLATRSEGHRLWQYSRSGSGPKLESQRTVPPLTKISERSVQKSWGHLWQPRLNVAWLPVESVFLKVIALPSAEVEELPSMVEFQLEKISPIPVTQIVWSFEALPRREGEDQVVVVLIAAREAVEGALGRLEEAGYLADRLELPQLHQMVAARPSEDRIWVYAWKENGQTMALRAWWIGGQLRNASFLHLPPGPGSAQMLATSIVHLAWGGQIEGWLSAPPPCTLVAEPSLAEELAPSLTAALGSPVEIGQPSTEEQLATLSAASKASANLLPTEFSLRYRQQFIDRLWMRGLGGLGVLYLFVVLACVLWLRWNEFQKGRVQDQITAGAAEHTQALQMKARVQVLQEQANLQFACLDCWKALSESLPEEMILTQMTFQRGRKLGLFGTVPADQQGKVTEFNEALRRAVANGQPLFSKVTTHSIQAAGGRPATWSIDCELKRGESE